MRIQHNVMAMNAYRNYTNNTSALSKNLERLSSGYKINRAGDDAAGLAISEKMRAQITGLQAAQKNVKDGISLVNTAEGAMQEIQDMLNRMVSLATQSANGTYDNEVDRKNLQAEVDQLRDEINRIADSANFNGIKLLDGSLDTNADLTTTADFTIGNGLPAVGQTLGTDTVLRNKANGDNGTQFSIDLHNLKFDAAAGNTLTINVGDNEIKLSVTDNYSGDATLDGTAIIDAIVTGTSGIEVTINEDSNYDVDDLEIGGQSFKLDDSNKADGKLTFIQNKAPQSAAEEVDGSMKVTISGSTAAQTAKYKIDLTNDGDISALAVGSVVKFGDISYTVEDLNQDGTDVDISDIGDKLAALGIDGFTIENEDGVLTVTATAPGAVDKPTASVKPIDNTTNNAVAGKHTVTGAVGTGAASTTDTIADKVTSTSDVVTINGEAVDLSKWDSSTAATLTTADGKYTLTVAADTGATAGAITVVANAAAGETADGDVVVSVGGNETTLSFSGGAGTPAKDTWTYDVTGWNDSQLGDLTIEVNSGDETLDYDALVAAGENGVKLGSTGYTAVLNGSTLTLTADTAGVVNTTTGAPANTPDDASFSVWDDTVKLTVEVEQEGLDGSDAISGMYEGSQGDWNVSTTDIKNVTSGGLERLASTYFDLTEDMVSEGSKLFIAGTTYTFTSDTKKLKGDPTAIDISSGDLSAIAKNLTEAAAANAKTSSVWTVGHDGSRITLTETVDHAALDSEDYPSDDYDLSTAEGVAKSLGFTAGETKSGTAMTLQIGETSDSYNQLKVSVGDMHTKALGIDEIDIGTPEGAQAAINTIKDAINYVSSVRGNLGAISNRLDHTANNLSVMAENITDAESTIRDTDIAEEMMAYTKNNILVQSAQAMLAQANQVPQGVLQLLQ